MCINAVGLSNSCVAVINIDKNSSIGIDGGGIDGGIDSCGGAGEGSYGSCIYGNSGFAIKGVEISCIYRSISNANCISIAGARDPSESCNGSVADGGGNDARCCTIYRVGLCNSGSTAVYVCSNSSSSID